jgi:hypothetical protein
MLGCRHRERTVISSISSFLVLDDHGTSIED